LQNTGKFIFILAEILHVKTANQSITQNWWFTFLDHPGMLYHEFEKIEKRYVHVATLMQFFL